ncbi:hypothetical protein AR457_32655 [Streptomyces agglomeratus]|uniref:Uncharacterized protein n=1 Tax=Streptomyces agglomeratus TaxID=285458 RepID=A0A1E5PG61_9ACTN|nr:hypothetical protein [Streptomyces agglomeratus]OEJ28512.1 hypothetical protein AS594_32565 [Streptomyces agglomeratus]OEJ37424.1 hypothetical protein BGK70_04005 [Streptomyces agglomeratus]OEJ48191.1 hypothetical protein AR457_32655 [Streptomyces agglomeratus]OEJ49965.1 hypothetical protein BGK72_03500 [Streptomyces agglomeratus]OEJ57292.1 hypothetical protein BGM19_04185 [Streptomyces agglomeratus]
MTIYVAPLQGLILLLAAVLSYALYRHSKVQHTPGIRPKGDIASALVAAVAVAALFLSAVAQNPADKNSDSSQNPSPDRSSATSDETGG